MNNLSNKLDLKKIDFAISEHIFNDRVNILPYSSELKYAETLIQFIRMNDNCYLKINLDIPGNIWEVEVKGNDYNCERKSFVAAEWLPEALAITALLQIMTEEEIEDKCRF